MFYEETSLRNNFFFISSYFYYKNGHFWVLIGMCHRQSFRFCRNNFIYGEVDCTGPGSNTKGRVPWEKKPSQINLNQYSLSSFINKDGWLSNIPTIKMRDYS